MVASQSSPAPATQLLLVEDNRSQAAMKERMLEDGGIEFDRRAYAQAFTRLI
jgi:hypothetical protein